MLINWFGCPLGRSLIKGIEIEAVVKTFRFTIGAVVLALTFGQLYATFDGKWLFIISTVLFQAASALCGGAPTMNAMIVGRVLAGIGGNGMYLGTLTLMILHTRENERSGYLALM